MNTIKKKKNGAKKNFFLFFKKKKFKKGKPFLTPGFPIILYGGNSVNQISYTMNNRDKF